MGNSFPKLKLQDIPAVMHVVCAVALVLARRRLFPRSGHALGWEEDAEVEVTIMASLIQLGERPAGGSLRGAGLPPTTD